MKRNFWMTMLLVVFSLFLVHDASARGKGKGHAKHHKKEYKHYQKGHHYKSDHYKHHAHYPKRYKKGHGKVYHPPVVYRRPAPRPVYYPPTRGGITINIPLPPLPIPLPR